MHIIGIPEGEKRDKMNEKIFEEILIENFPNMRKETLTQLQEAHRVTAMFLDWKNQYCQNDYSTQSNLQNQLNPYQITFSHNQSKNFLKLYRNTKDSERSSNFKKEKQSQRSQTPRLQAIL